MKVGDLVKVPNDIIGIIVGFDIDGDPLVFECGSVEVAAHYRYHVEVIE